MPDSYSDPSNEPAAQECVLPWGSCSLSWPIEQVVAQVEVSASRDANAFEAILFQVLDIFGDAPPTLAEAATELGMRDPVLLREVLGRLIETGVVESNHGTAPLDLTTCRITEAGRNWMNGKAPPGASEKHGTRFNFDAITGEHVPQLGRNVQRMPTYPVLAPADLPERLSHMGLDRARQLIESQKEPFRKDGSTIRDLVIQVDEGGHLWLPVKLSLSIRTDGVLLYRLDGVRPAQPRWFDQQDLDIPAMPAIARATAERFAGNLPLPETTWTAWLERVNRLISPWSTLLKARELLDSAQTDVVLHAAWCEIPELRQSVITAAGRGVRCRVRVATPAQAGLVPTQENVTSINSAEPGAQPPPMAMVIDGIRAISIDQVTVTSPGGRKFPVVIASSVRTDRAVQLLEQVAQ